MALRPSRRSCRAAAAACATALETSCTGNRAEKFMNGSKIMIINDFNRIPVSLIYHELPRLHQVISAAIIEYDESDHHLPRDVDAASHGPGWPQATARIPGQRHGGEDQR
jgi:hypothetical protein